MTHRTIITATLTLAATLAVTAPAHADETCTTVDYQGAPLEMCPPVEPDSTNCYTGDYQGAPIEVCMPTGWQPDPSWTFQGEPIVMHVSKDYIPPAPQATQPPVTETPASRPAVGSDPVDELHAAVFLARSMST